MKKNKYEKKLEHLTEEQIQDLISRYYNHENNKNLISEFKIDISESQLYKVFPPQIFENYKCEYCEQSLVADRKSKTNNHYMERDLYCLNCSHKLIRNCNCENCCEKAEKKLQLKKELIVRYLAIHQPSKVNYNDLDFKGKIYLGALCEFSLSEDMYTINEYIVSRTKVKDLAPTKKMIIDIYSYLLKIKAIKISPYSDADAFYFEDNKIIPKNLLDLKYELNLVLPPNKADLLNDILYPKNYGENYKKEIHGLWLEIALEECIEYLLYKFSEINFEFSPAEKTYVTFQNLLVNFSVSQIYSIIYAGVNDASNKYMSKSMSSKKHAANYVITFCGYRGETALRNNWDIKGFSRIRDLPQSELSLFLFEKVAKIGELGFSYPPTEL